MAMTRDEWRRRPRRSGHFIGRGLRFAIYARDGFACVYCRSAFPLRLDGAGLHLDHVVPRSKGGSHAPENLVTACASCNSRKQNSTGPLYYPLDNEPYNVRRRVRRALARRVNPELGRWLARMARAA